MENMMIFHDLMLRYLKKTVLSVDRLNKDIINHVSYCIKLFATRKLHIELNLLFRSSLHAFIISKMTEITVKDHKVEGKYLCRV
uniref:Uncharacterized protein n=1 Tax=Romanomermis culicivorax TaxID=13658 RepID=A0A915J451_ROMCU